MPSPANEGHSETSPGEGGVPRPPAGRLIHVVLPAYNEAANVGAVLKTLDELAGNKHLALHPIVVDDGSRDGTPDIVAGYSGSMKVSLIKHPENRGLGAAIRSGLERAVAESHGEDIIVTMDADDTFTPGTIPEMLKKIDSGMDVLIASRYQPGSVVVGVPPIRRFMSFSASVLFQAVLPIPGVKDYTCGYRAYRASALKKAFAQYRQEFIDQEGFQCMVDILLKLRGLGLRFGEVPLTLRYDRKGGKSKMKVARTAIKTLLLLVKRRLGVR